MKPNEYPHAGFVAQLYQALATMTSLARSSETFSPQLAASAFEFGKILKGAADRGLVPLPDLEELKGKFDECCEKILARRPVIAADPADLMTRNLLD